MPSTGRHEITLSPEHRLMADELAAHNGLSLSASIAGVIDEYGRGRWRRPIPDGFVEMSVKVVVPDDSWDMAMARAKAEGISISQAVREGLERKVHPTTADPLYE